MAKAVEKIVEGIKKKGNERRPICLHFVSIPPSFWFLWFSSKCERRSLNCRATLFGWVGCQWALISMKLKLLINFILSIYFNFHNLTLMHTYPHLEVLGYVLQYKMLSRFNSCEPVVTYADRISEYKLRKILEYKVSNVTPYTCR